jgi:hypothetical protein
MEFGDGVLILFYGSFHEQGSPQEMKDYPEISQICIRANPPNLRSICRTLSKVGEIE